MADNMTILVGTFGQGVLRSADGGDTWRRIAIDQGLHSDAVVRCLAAHPNKPNLITQVATKASILVQTPEKIGRRTISGAVWECLGDVNGWEMTCGGP